MHNIISTVWIMMLGECVIYCRKASKENTRDLLTTAVGRVDQIGSEENYIAYTEDDGNITLHEVYPSRKDTMIYDDRT